MVWKIYHIQSGSLVRAGFESEEDAREWLDENSSAENSAFEVEEMDEDEWQEYLETKEKSGDDTADQDGHVIGRHPDTFDDDFEQGHDGDDHPDSEEDFLVPEEEGD